MNSCTQLQNLLQKTHVKQKNTSYFFAMLLVAFAALSGLLSGFVFPILNNEQLHPASESASENTRQTKKYKLFFCHAFGSFCSTFGASFWFCLPHIE